MTLNELRKKVEDGYSINLIHKTGDSIYVLMDNDLTVNLDIRVIHYFRTDDWKYTVRYTGNDFVCALNTFQQFLDEPVPEGDGLEFNCPNCPSHRLECCEDGPYVSEITVIDKDGDFNYGAINAHGEVERIQCVRCGYVLKDGETGENIINNEEVVEWIKESCKDE